MYSPDAYTTMGTKIPRSPSPPAEPAALAPAPAPPAAPAPLVLHDTQELQINAILQGVAAENNSNARSRKRKRKVSIIPRRDTVFNRKPV